MKPFRYFLFCGVSLAALALVSSQSLANPEGGNVVSGSAVIEYAGKKLDVYQQTNRAVIDWRSFDIAPDEHTQFHQPSSSATVLNRVLSHDPSQILGKLTANGNVVLINPNGVFFGKDSRVDVNGLIATTADIQNNDFIGGKLNFSQMGNPNAQIINEGTITAKEAGLIGLVAPRVINSGHIFAKLGRVELASGDSFVVDLYGDGLLGLEVGTDVESQLVKHTGKIEAEGGTVVLSAATGRNIVDSLIEVKGEIKAPAVSQQGGKIIIAAQGSNAVIGNNPENKGQKTGYSTVVVEAELDVSGQGEDEKGGFVSITADAVFLKNQTMIDASGQAGGGEILIGGDYLGQGLTPTALGTFVEKEVILNVDALDRGDGGKAVVWADKITQFFGKIFARGGENAGDGGFVEVSGKQFLTFKGDVDTRGFMGETGTLLLDPADIVIADGIGDSAADGADSFAGNPSGTIGTILEADVGPTVLFKSELEGIAATTNISLASSNSITINDMSDDMLNFAQTSPRSVSFSAGAGGITMLDSNDMITTAGGALNFITSDGGVVSLGHLNTNGGLTTFNVEGDSYVYGTIEGAGGVTKTGSGELTLFGSNSYSGNTIITNGTLFATNNNSLGSSLIIMNGGAFGGVGGALVLENDMRLNQNTSGQIVGDVDLTFNGLLTNFNGNRTLTVHNTGMTTFAGGAHLSQNTTNRTMTLNGTGDITILGTIEKGGGGTDASNLTKAGSGNLFILGDSTYTGNTTISGSGDFVILGQHSLGGEGLIILNGGGLRVDSDTVLNNQIRLSANSRIEGSADLTFNGALTNHNGSRVLNVNNTGLTILNGEIELSDNATNRTLTVSGSGDTIINGIISNAGSTASNFQKTGTGTVTLNADNTHTGNITVNGGTLIINGASVVEGTTTLTSGTAVLNNNNALGTTLVVFNGGTLSSGDSPLTLDNEMRLQVNSEIAGNSDITLNGLLTNFNGNRTLNVNNTGLMTLNGDIHLSQNTTNRTWTLSGDGDVVINGNIVKGGGGTDASNFTKTGNGTVTLFGNNTYTGSTTVNGGILRIGTSERIADTSTLNVGANGTFDLNGHTETVNSVTNNGVVLMGSGGSLLTNGVQNHINGYILGHNATLGSLGSGNITATNTLNDFTGHLSVTTNGAINIVDANELALGNVQGSTVLLGALGGDLILNGQIEGLNATGSSIRLYTENAFINNFGANALVTNGTARFQVFSDNSENDTRNGLTGFNRYGCSYNSGAPDCAAGTNTPGAGDGFYMIYAPTLTITGIAADNKIYDATDVATLSGVAGLSGVLNGDTITFDDSGVSAEFSDKNVGNNKDVTVSGYVLTGVNHGYLFEQPAGLTANITPYDLLVTGLSAQNKIYNGNLAATLLGAPAIVPLGLDDVMLQGVASGTFDTKNVGNGKSVTVSGLSIIGDDIGNYNLVLPTGLTADITLRPLSLSSFVAAHKIFDETTDAQVLSYVFDNAVTEDHILLNNFNAHFDTPDIGTNKVVTLLSANFTGTDASNYNFVLGVPTTLANITEPPKIVILPNSVSFNSQGDGNKFFIQRKDSFSLGRSSDVSNQSLMSFTPILNNLVRVHPFLQKFINLLPEDEISKLN